MLPELFRIPFLNITLSTYGALLTIAFMSGIQTSAWLAERDGLQKSKLYGLGACMVPSSIIGTKLLTIIISWNKFEDHWEQSLAFAASTSVGAYLGGFLVALGVSAILTSAWHLRWRKGADASAPRP